MAELQHAGGITQRLLGWTIVALRLPYLRTVKVV